MDGVLVSSCVDQSEAGLCDTPVGDEPDGDDVAVGVDGSRDAAAAELTDQLRGGVGAVVHGNIVIAGTLQEKSLFTIIQQSTATSVKVSTTTCMHYVQTS